MRGAPEHGPAVTHQAGFWPDHEALLRGLREEVTWEASMSARETASFGRPYNYAQMVYPARPMHRLLVPVVDALEARLGIAFNNCLLNYYPDQRAKMGFHSDDVSELVPDTGVAIVSLGATRRLSFRRREDPEVRAAYSLEGGSLLFMPHAVQHRWAHALKRQRPPAGPRISLTWRCFR
ncbi:MAG: alpha-ketoglutarate-dependent dioxygenase AlkB [Myxococcota bacterium]